MAEVGQVFVNFGANTQGLLAGTARAGNILQRFSQTGVGAAMVMGASFVTLSRIMTGFANAAVSGFKDFDYHIVRAKALSSATTAEFEAMRDTASELGRTTEFMAKEVAQGMSNLALAGFKANEIIEMIPTSLRLATAGGVNLSKTNTIMANAMRAFNLEANEADRVANTLTATFTTTNTTLESLAQTLKNSAGVLSVVGVEIEEVVAAAGVLGDVGINASVAGTGLKNFGIKLAKTFGMMKDGAKSAKEFFESLDVTKDKLFDAETGTLNMVDATMAFKNAMDTLGKARAPEFLAQFSRLFGARAAASIAQLVKNAEKYKMQVENTRMTGMVGDVQRVVESMRELGEVTEYADEIQQGLNKAIKKDLLSGLEDASLYMEEFVQGGRGAAGVIDRMAQSFRDTQKALEMAFGGDVFGKTEDGMLVINEYSKNNAKEVYRLGQVIDELAKKDIGTQRRQQLEAERAALEKMVVSVQKTVQELTEEGRARLLNVAALKKHLDAQQASADGTSKTANQIRVLNQVYQGNSKNVAMAAQAFGIQLKAGEKLGEGLENVEREMGKLTFSTDAQTFAFNRLISQTATTNTALNMQAIQLQTLDGIIKIFKSGIERVSNAIANSMAPALAAGIQSVTQLMRALTSSREEIDKGITATMKLEDAWVKIVGLFTDGEGIFSRIQKSFEGLTSIGKALAFTVGTLGAAGLAAGGAFIWAQALLPALMALSGTFFTLVAPLAAIVAISIKVGLEFKKLRDKAKEFGDEFLDRTDPIVQAFLTFRDAVGSVRDEFGGLYDKLVNVLGLTEKIAAKGGELMFFGTSEDGVITLQEKIKTLNTMLGNAGIKGTDAGDAIMNAFRAGDIPKTVALLEDAGMYMDEINGKVVEWGVGTAAQQQKFMDINNQIKVAKELHKSVTEELGRAKNVSNKTSADYEKIAELEKKQEEALSRVNKRMDERLGLQNEIIFGKGKQGRLTENEIQQLGELQKKISESSNQVGAMKRRHAELAGVQQRNKEQQAEFVKLSAELGEKQKNLIGLQRDYNKILDRATSKNPFDLIMRSINKITSSDTFKKFINESASMVADVATFVAETAIPKIIDVVGKMFGVIRRFLNNVGPGIIAVIRSIGYVMGEVFKAATTVMSEILGDVLENENAFKGLNDVLLQVSVAIRALGDGAAKVISYLTPAIRFIISLIGAIYEKLGPPFVKLISAIGNLFVAVFGAISRVFGDTFGKMEGGVDVLGLIAKMIEKIAEQIEAVSAAISGTGTGELKKLGLIGTMVVAGFVGIKMVLGLIDKLGYALYQMGQRASAVMSGLASGFGKIQPIIQAIFPNITSLGAAIKAFFGFIGAHIGPILGIVAIVIASIAAITEAFKKNFGNVRQTAAGFFGAIWDLVKNLFGGVWSVISKVMSLVASVIKTVWNIGKALAPLVGIVLSLVFAIVTPVIKIVSWLVKHIFGLISWLIGIVVNILNSEFMQQVINTIGTIAQAIHDMIMGTMNFVKMAVGWILDFISPVTNWIGEQIAQIWGIVKWLWEKIWGMIQKGWSIIVDYLMSFMRAIQGVATIVSGIFTWDIGKVREGLAMVFEGIAGMAIKIYEFVAALWAKLIGLIAEGLGNLLAGALGKFQGIADLLGFGDKIREMQEGIKNFGKEIGENLEKGVDGTVNKMQEGVKSIADKIRGPQDEIKEGEKKAEDQIDKDKEQQEKTKEEIEKEKQAQKADKVFGRQQISELDTTMKGLNDNVGKIAEGRQNNVTNNTYVEYKAAEDDEVNRRMIERIMNDVLKADVGAIMGDTSDMGTQDG